MTRNALAFALAATAVSALLLAGCKRQEAPVAAQPVAEVPAASAVTDVQDHGSPASAAPGFDVKAFAGTYGGTLPCADCPGIDTSVALSPEGSYTLTETYQDAEASSFVSEGTWSVRGDGKSVHLDPTDKDEYDRWFEVVSPTQLRALDREGKTIAGPTDYILQRR